MGRIKIVIPPEKTPYIMVGLDDFCAHITSMVGYPLKDLGYAVEIEFCFGGVYGNHVTFDDGAFRHNQEEIHGQINPHIISVCSKRMVSIGRFLVTDFDIVQSLPPTKN